MTLFADYYRGKKVLVTGHTGFKGSWLAVWLADLGAKVIGLSLDPPTRPSHFAVARLPEIMTDERADIRSFEQVDAVIQRHRPDLVFHLAAQPIVRRSFNEPIETYAVNVMGTLHVLESARRCPSVQSTLVVTSDKCYRNVEWAWPYRETDPLGGHDPYSASKACAELVVENYQSQRFLQHAEKPRDMHIASARAGNVLGGGDWAEDRLVPDIVRAVSTGQPLTIRSPQSVRPWQHVLESLSGYLWLVSRLPTDPDRYRSAWNFGPDAGRTWTTAQIVDYVLNHWPGADPNAVVLKPDPTIREAMMLQVDSSKAHAHLGWRATWDVERTLAAVIDWYRAYQTNPDAMIDVTRRQIAEYAGDALRHERVWAA